MLFESKYHSLIKSLYLILKLKGSTRGPLGIHSILSSLPSNRIENLEKFGKFYHNALLQCRIVLIELYVVYTDSIRIVQCIQNIKNYRIVQDLNSRWSRRTRRQSRRWSSEDPQWAFLILYFSNWEPRCKTFLDVHLNHFEYRQAPIVLTVRSLFCFHFAYSYRLKT